MKHTEETEMKKTALRITFTAVAIAAAAVTGSAQTMKAEIPFAFEATGAHMQSGSYTVSMSRSTGAQMTIKLTGENGHGILAVPRLSSTPAWATTSPIVLSFACGEGWCELTSLKDSESRVYNFATHKPSAGARVATVVLHTDTRAD
jgi:hypothetical protein